MNIRRCPHCKSFNVRRSEARGVLESFALQGFMLRPYRCHDCYTRYYGFAFRSKAGQGSRRRSRRPAQVTALVLQRIGLATLVLGVLVLLANSGQAIAKLSVQEGRPLFDRPSISAVSTTPRAAAIAQKFRDICASQNNAADSPSAVRGLSSPLGMIVQADEATMNGAAVPPNTQIYSGDSISVSAGGAALIRFSPGSLAAVTNAAEVCFSGNNGTVQAGMLSGSMQVAWGGENPFVVQTADYRIEPHGPGDAQFHVAVSPDQKTSFETEYGNVTISRLGSQPTIAMAKQVSTVSAAFPQNVANAPTTTPIGTVIQVAAATRNGAPLSVNTPINNQDEVKTGVAGSAEVQLSTLTKVFLHQDTTVEFSRPVQLVWVELKSGEVVSDSQGPNGAVIVTPKFYIQPASSAHSRIYVSVMADHSTYIESDAGNVRIEDIHSGKFYTLQAKNTILIPPNVVGIPGLSSHPPVTAPVLAQTPAHPAVVAQTQPAPVAPQPKSVSKSQSHKSIIILGVAGGAAATIALAALAAGGTSRPPVSPSSPF